MKFNIVLCCAFHCTFDDSVSNYFICKSFEKPIYINLEKGK